MKKTIFILLLICISHSLSALENRSSRIRNWIATYHTKKGNVHVMVQTDGSLLTWHAGETPALIPNFNDAIEVSAGATHLLLLKSDGSVWAMGENESYQLGNPELKGTDIKNIPVKVNGISNAIAVSAMNDSSYALLQDGTVRAWGQGDNGMLGDGAALISSGSTAEESAKSFPVKVKGIKGAIAIAGAMVLLPDGTIWTWGNGRRGRLGNNSQTSTSVPTKVIGITNAIAISARTDGAIALLSDGTVAAWGYNYKGQLGNGIPKSKIYQGSVYEKSLIPVKVINLSNVIDIDASSSCLALLKDGTVKGWGWGEISALGPLGGDQTTSPVNVFQLKQVKAIKAGNGSGFALLKDGTLVGWGADMVSTGLYKQSNKVIKIALQ